MEGPQLGTDQISEVLSWLPCKTLARFRCVSKDWQSLLSHDSCFRALRRRRNQPLRFLAALVLPETSSSPHSPPCLYHQSISSGDIDSSDSPAPKEVIVGETTKTEAPVMSICLPWMGALILYYGRGDNFYVCNPTTRQLLKLPKGSPHVSWSEPVGALAYLPNTNEYRVIKLFQPPDTSHHHHHHQTQCEVLTIREGGNIVNPSGPSWKLLKNKCCPYPVDSSPGCYVNGRVYWLVASYFLNDHQDHRDGLIVSFDVVAEEFNMVREPQGCSPEIGLLSLKEVRGNLLLMDWVDVSFTKFNIWVMMKGFKDQAWERRYTLDIGRVAAQRDLRWTTLVFVNLSDIENEEILVLTSSSVSHCLEYYNTKAERLRVVDISNSVNGAEGKRIERIPTPFLGLYWADYFSLGTS